MFIVDCYFPVAEGGKMKHDYLKAQKEQRFDELQFRLQLVSHGKSVGVRKQEVNGNEQYRTVVEGAPGVWVSKEDTKKALQDVLDREQCTKYGKDAGIRVQYVNGHQQFRTVVEGAPGVWVSRDDAMATFGIESLCHAFKAYSSVGITINK